MNLHAAAIFVQSQLKSNQFLAGGLGVGMVGGALVWLRNIPGKIFAFIKGQLSVTLTIHGEDNFSTYLEFWLANHKWIKRARKLRVVGRWVEDEDDESPSAYNPSGRLTNRKDYNVDLTAGPGNHMLWFKGHMIWVNRHEQDTESTKIGDSGQRAVTITLTTWGRSQKIFRDLVQEALLIHDEDSRVAIYAWDKEKYVLVSRKRPRKMSSIFINPQVRDAIIADATHFLESREWFSDHGVPYRKGYMLHGKPGTGKSTLILALANVLNLNVYVVNTNSINTDQSLENAFQMAGTGIVVMEDLDAVKAGAVRPEDGKLDEDKSTFGISLSGLLNAIDGIASKEGRILFVTSNHPENLDPALTRPGRIDKTFELEYLTEPLARAMTHHFLPMGADAFYDHYVAPIMPISPATLQNMLLTELVGEGKVVPIHGEAHPSLQAEEVKDVI
jgi:hypothetical protein